MTLSCVAIEEQRGWRDLRQLEQSLTVRWIPAKDADIAPEPLVACGLWAARDPNAGAALCRRAEKGLGSLLVARFEPGDLGPVVGAPVAIRIAANETTEVSWEDGRRYAVPGFTVIETALPPGHWARSPSGTVVFAYRPHTQAGLIVLCTATIAGPALGTDPAEQRALLHRILEELARSAPECTDESGDRRAPAGCATASEFLEQNGPDGALVLLALWQAGGQGVEAASLEAIGAALPDAHLTELIASLPDAAPDEIERALRSAGWGAHLRALARHASEAT